LIFQVPKYTLATPWELGFYLILGVLAGVIAIVFIKTLYKVEDLFDGLKIPGYYKPAIGGLCIGIMGFILLFYTNDLSVFGVGYDSIKILLEHLLM